MTVRLHRNAQQADTNTLGWGSQTGWRLTSAVLVKWFLLSGFI
jgi:hypothetical protein